MIRIGLIVLVAALMAVIGVLVLRPDVAATSSFDPDVTVECTAATGVSGAACVAWADGILSGGAPSTTFEAEDIVRLRLDRGLFGLGDGCRAEWFLGRYPDDAVWTEDAACPEAD